MNSKKDIYLSVVIPVFNEEDNIDILLKTLVDSIPRLSYEIIIIDDGSTDGTWERVKHYAIANTNIKGVKLVRNFGHQHALLAGLACAQGLCIISMDGDLQHPPSLIPAMLVKYQAGFLVVNTCRDDTKVATLFKRKSSSLFYKIFSFLTDVPMAPGLSDFRLLDRLVVEQLLKLEDVDIFVRGAVEWLGFPSITIPYEAGKRFAGVSKYSLAKMINFARGSIVSFSTKPLVLGVWLGIFTSMFAFFEIVYILYQVLNHKTVPGWASTVGIISFLFGVLFIMLGIVGTYIARIHIALQNRPKYVVGELTSNFDL